MKTKKSKSIKSAKENSFGAKPLFGTPPKTKKPKMLKMGM